MRIGEPSPSFDPSEADNVRKPMNTRNHQGQADPAKLELIAKHKARIEQDYTGLELVSLIEHWDVPAP
jgi:hypothetical protein